MQYSFLAYGHKNVTSLHKSTFEITTDKDLTLKGDCIIGLNSDVTLNDFPAELKKEIQKDGSKIELILETENNNDVITGFGSSKLTLNHPSDMVCRKSDFTCSRTLMIKADKAARDLNVDLINDLKEGATLKVTIKTC
ncbi:MAG: DUF371 domain-containing protein [Methanosphaera sp.]|nr:DUF371 domain-containing protein [Methanosphaera sp.]